MILLAGVLMLFSGLAVPREPLPPQLRQTPPVYRGKVVALKEGSITIQPEGSVKVTSDTRTVYVQDNTTGPREFAIHESLLPGYQGGKIPRVHLFADVQVGDVVCIDCRRLRGLDTCTDIQIYRRPGGKVPPAIRDERTSAQNRWDNKRNAEQFAEETFVPKWVPWMRVHLSR